jgi:hypothetical protein
MEHHCARPNLTLMNPNKRRNPKKPSQLFFGLFAC